MLDLFLGPFTGNPQVQVNWKAMAENSLAFCSADSMTSDFIWDDPSHMQIQIIDKLLDHWYRRQDEGKVDLEFTGCLPKDMSKHNHHHQSKIHQDRPEEEEEEIDVGKGKAPSRGNKPEDIIDPNPSSSTLHKTAQDKVSVRATCKLRGEMTLKRVNSL